jgi:hypothetical protein
VMVWALSKMSAEERDKLLNGFSIAIRDHVSSSSDGTIPPKGPRPGKPKSKRSRTRSTKSDAAKPVAFENPVQLPRGRRRIRT